MTRGKHTPPGDRSFALSVVVHLAAGAALVAVVAAAFWGIGQIRGPQDGPVIVGAPGDEDPEPSPADSPDAQPSPEQSPQAQASPDQPEDDGVEPDPDPTSASTTEADVDPAEVSVQVLDATGDGGARLQDVLDRLRADGWRVVASNRAARYYERSTVFYSPGHEEAAQALADRYPEFELVQAKPDNLTSSVAVHLVIGGDYPEP